MDWRKRLGESLIDRVVLVVLAAVLLGAVECRYEELQRVGDARAAVSTVMTDALMQQRRSLMSAVEEYMLLIDDMIETNATPGPGLSRAERRIRLALNFFSSVGGDDGVSHNASELESAMVRLSNFVRGDRPSSGGERQSDSQSAVTILQDLQDAFTTKYVLFSSDIRMVTLEAVRVESATR